MLSMGLVVCRQVGASFPCGSVATLLINSLQCCGPPCHLPLTPIISWSLLKFMSVELVMLPNHLILCQCLLLLLPSIFPSIRVFSNESLPCIRWLKYWSYSFSISLSNEYSGLIFYRISLQSEGLSRVFSSTTNHVNSFVFSLLYGPTLTSIRYYWKNHSFTTGPLSQSDIFAF